MDIVLLSYGSRGDVQPFVALARALRHVGHQVRVVGPPNFAELGPAYAIDYVPVGGDLQAQLNSDRIKTLTQGANPIQLLRILRDELLGLIDDAARETWQAAQGGELVIGTGPTSASAAEALGVPFIEAAMQPVTPTRAFPSPVAPPWLQLGGTVNRLTHVAFEQAFWQLFRMNTNRMRTHVLGLLPYGARNPLRQLRAQGLLRLYAYSVQVVPRPDDWPGHHRVTGYWFLPPPPGWQPPAELSTFLAAGPPPVYVGFGSMLASDAQRLTALVVEALAQTGQRGLLAGGWGALEGWAHQSETIFVVDTVPHHWLFPRMAGIVHHGGAGTTGAALRSGVPSLAVPFGFDQPFWGQRVAALGVGPQPIPRAQITAPRLAAAIDQMVHTSAMRERAAWLGMQIQQEYGTAQAIDQIHRVLRTTTIT
ncbi:MAG: glycosyltransferase family 1 protein [Chloroflexales bacterium]|nr:glycosyltransferase family 1 protein [Chloroflexales bacterium]